MATSHKNIASKEDIISELPAEVKERILECLPTRDAARTALLSTHWKDVWLQHGRLVFDRDFFRCVSKYNIDGKEIFLPKIIYQIFMLRAGPVKKFTLSFQGDDPWPGQFDMDMWLRFLSRNGVQELNISAYDAGCVYDLPLCIVSCRTIKKLVLQSFDFYLPINARGIFPRVTSLAFKRVVFKRNGHDDDGDNDVVFTIPNVEKLAFDECDFMHNFEISAPKLKSLSIINNYVSEDAKLRWFMLHLKVIKTLCMDEELLMCKAVAVAAPTFPTAINLQVIRLYNLNFSCGKQLSVVMQLLQKSPNLCDLEINVVNFSGSIDKEAASRLLEDPDRSFINQDMKKLNTVKIECFKGSRLEMHFVKSLLSKSPALGKVFIKKSCNIDTSIVVEIQNKLLSFPRASPKAQILFLSS